jgi:hypothetical protein
MRAITRVGGLLAIVSVPFLLSACLPLPLPSIPELENDREVLTGPTGWTEFPHCPAGPNDDWIWIEGFPAEALEEAGIEPKCGDTWIEADGDSFENVTVSDLSDADLAALDAELTSAGWVKLWDDFVPAEPRAIPAPVGARDYYLDGVTDGDFTRLAIELYGNGTDPVTYIGYIDYLSPETRALH